MGEQRKEIESRIKDILYCTGSIKNEKEKHKKREEFAKKALEENENDVSRLVLARIYILHGKLPNATKLVNLILADNPENILAKKEQLRIFLKQGHFLVVEQEVLKILNSRERTIGTENDDINTLDFMSFLLSSYLSQNKLEDAEKLALDMKSRGLSNTGRVHRIVNEALVQIYGKNGNIVEQEIALRELCSKNPNNSKYVIMLANLLEKEKKLEDALSLLNGLPKKNHAIRQMIKSLGKRLEDGPIEKIEDKGLNNKENVQKKDLNEIRKDIVTRVLNGDITLDDVDCEKEKLEEMINPFEVSIILAEVYMIFRMPEIAERCIRQSLRCDEMKDNLKVRQKLRQILEFTQRKKPIFNGLIADKFDVAYGKKIDDFGETEKE